MVTPADVAKVKPKQCHKYGFASPGLLTLPRKNIQQSIVANTLQSTGARLVDFCISDTSVRSMATTARGIEMFEVGDKVIVNRDKDWFWHDYPEPGVVVSSGKFLEVEIYCEPQWRTSDCEPGIATHVFTPDELLLAPLDNGPCL